MGWLALGGVGLLLLLFLLPFFRRRSSPNGAFTFSSDPPNYGDVTEPDDATEPASEAFPAAMLVLVRGEGELPQSIPLYRQHFERSRENQWSVGRSYQENEAVIDSRRVSKIHATITEQNGNFRIRDEMSSGGTYITSAQSRLRQRIEAMAWVPLTDEDIINFNSIAYRFEIDRGDYMSADTEPETGITEPEMRLDDNLTTG